jgi:hypothetical protein
MPSRLTPAPAGLQGKQRAIRQLQTVSCCRKTSRTESIRTTIEIHKEIVHSDIIRHDDNDVNVAVLVTDVDGCGPERHKETACIIPRLTSDLTDPVKYDLSAQNSQDTGCVMRKTQATLKNSYFLQAAEGCCFGS